MASSSIAASPVIKGNDRYTPDVHISGSVNGPVVSLHQSPQRSQTGSCSPENRTCPRTGTQQLISAPSASLPDSSHRTPRPSRDTCQNSPKNNNHTFNSSTPELFSPSQESTWSQYAGRLRNLSQFCSPTTYTKPPKARATREPSPAASVGSQTPTTPGSAFCFLASKLGAFKAMASPSFSAAGCGDQLIDLDIVAALFPDGVPQDEESISSVVFKNLQINAIDLLHRFQSTYQSQIIEFRALKADKEVLEDEKSEAQTRAQHAKIQLEGIARTSAEKEATLRACLEELQNENRLLRQDQQLPRRTASSIISTLSEDLGAEEDQAKKLRHHSGDTYKTGAGSDTDEESVADVSIFSRSRSPTQATTIFEIGGQSEYLPQRRVPIAVSSCQKPSQSQMTTFRKLMKGFSSEADARIVTECNNCQGQDASIAWDTARLMRDENRSLKMRIAELESALEGALDIVNGLEF